MIACDVSEDFTNIARKFWAEAGVEHKVQLKLAPAADTLSQLVEAGEENTFDFAFIDADKVAADIGYINIVKLRQGSARDGP